MIIDTSDDRRLEIVHTLDDRVFIAVDGVHGSQETIMLDMEEATQLHSYLTRALGDVS